MIKDGKLIFEGIHITNPYLDETGRFEVDPLKYYGLTSEQLKKILGAS